MPIVASELLRKFSVTTGTAGNQQTGAASGALGKYISTTIIPDGTLNGLFDDISGAENAVSTIDYRCEFIHNNNASLTLQVPFAWISSEVAGGANISIGVDTTVATPVGSAAAQAVQVANELTAPSGVTFSAPTTKATGLALSNIPNGQCKALWWRRTATNSAALSNDGATVTIEGDTAA